MNKSISKKIEKAEKLRKKQAFPMSLFVEPDYSESASIFIEVAKECTLLDDKIKFYLEAAKTFLMEESREYGNFEAYKCYKSAFEVLYPQDKTTAIEYYNKGVECLEKTDKVFFSGDEYTKVGDLFGKTDPKRALVAYKKAQSKFIEEPNYPVHLKELEKKILKVQLQTQDIDGAIGTLENIRIKHSQLCKTLLKLLSGKSDIEDALSQKESDLVMVLLNQDKDSGIQALEQFKNKTHLDPVEEEIFDMFIDSLKPENDIC
ncbi:hypothetical protein GINT2_000767 [Glugoides intestinalis]